MKRSRNRECSFAQHKDAMVYLTLSVAVMASVGRFFSHAYVFPDRPLLSTKVNRAELLRPAFSFVQPKPRTCHTLLFDTEASEASTDIDISHISPVTANGKVKISDRNHVVQPTSSGEEPPPIADSATAVELTNGLQELDDSPRPTENGGYTHTSQSRAKISRANKGKTPWNKGKKRSDEVRARIAAGVRAKNRERFLKKLEDMGLTEDEYEEQQLQIKTAKEAERRNRRTENGGYRPTEETKQKISRILKEKYASGEIDRKRNIDPSRVRRGFTHSEETRQKISASLRKRWANDPDYRANMIEKTSTANNKEQVRQKISETLRKKWQEPEFREKMMEKIANRKTSSGTHDLEHRERISAAMKAKWQDSAYREKTLQAIAKRKQEAGLLRAQKSLPPVKRRKVASNTREKKATTTTRAVVPKGGNRMTSASPSSPRPIKPRAVTRAVKKKAKKKKKKIAKPPAVTAVAAIKVKQPRANGESAPKKKTTEEAPKKKKKKNGSRSLLREERRDLYDLLYGDEDSDDSHSPMVNAFALGDENLDDFDPYGLEDC